MLLKTGNFVVKRRGGGGGSNVEAIGDVVKGLEIP